MASTRWHLPMTQNIYGGVSQGQRVLIGSVNYPYVLDFSRPNQINQGISQPHPQTHAAERTLALGTLDFLDPPKR